MSRKIKVFALILLMVMAFESVAFANVNSVKAPPELIESNSTDDIFFIKDNKQLIFKPMTNDGLIGPCYSYIEYDGKELYLEGRTVSPRKADKLTLSIYLQEWKGDKWVNVDNWVFYDYDFTVLIEGVATTDFTRGKYYRTKCIHGVLLDGAYDSFTTTSDYVYIP